MANEIFVSYAPQDVDFAKQLSKAFHEICIDPWIDIEDTNASEQNGLQIERGIKNAHSFVFVISPDSLNNNECIKQAQMAISNGKQLAPVFLRGESRQLFGIIEKKVPELGKINAVYFNRTDATFQQAFDNLLHILRGDYSMSNEVFVSYSRRDIGFIKLLDQVLRNNKIDPWVDWEDIPPGADWRKKIFMGIENAHTFIFNISPDSVTSDVCAEEINHAILHGKRLIPVMVKKVPDNQIPVAFKGLPIIDCSENANQKAAFDLLIKTFDTNLEYARYHTRLQQRVITTWAQKGKDENALLTNDQLTEATQWLQQSKNKQPKPTPLQNDFIEASLQKYERDKTKNFGGMLYQAQELVAEDKFDDAEKLLLKALEITPNDIGTLQYLTTIYIANGKAQEALETAQKAIEAGDTHVSELNLATIYMYSYEEKEALKWLKKASKSMQNKEEAFNMMKVISQFAEHINTSEGEAEQYTEEFMNELSALIDQVEKRSEKLKSDVYDM